MEPMPAAVWQVGSLSKVTTLNNWWLLTFILRKPHPKSNQADLLLSLCTLPCLHTKSENSYPPHDAHFTHFGEGPELWPPKIDLIWWCYLRRIMKVMCSLLQSSSLTFFWQFSWSWHVNLMHHHICGHSACFHKFIWPILIKDLVEKKATMLNTGGQKWLLATVTYWAALQQFNNWYSIYIIESTSFPKCILSISLAWLWRVDTNKWNILCMTLLYWCSVNILQTCDIYYSLVTIMLLNVVMPLAYLIKRSRNILWTTCIFSICEHLSVA